MPIFKSYNLTLFCVLSLLMRANLADKIYSLSFKVKMETKKNHEMFEFLTLNTFSYIIWTNTSVFVRPAQKYQ